MQLRLKSEIYVQALIRRINGTFAQGMAAAYVARRGDANAGGIFIRVNRLDGTAGVLTLFTNMEGEQTARVVVAPHTAEKQAADFLARETARDPDIWLVDIEDAQGRHFLEEKIDGDWPVLEAGGK